LGLISHVEKNLAGLLKDFWPYGLEANRPTWTAIGQYVHKEGLAPPHAPAGGIVRARRGMIGAAHVVSTSPNWHASTRFLEASTTTDDEPSNDRRPPRLRC
jgi:hypothetical protein